MSADAQAATDLERSAAAEPDAAAAPDAAAESTESAETSEAAEAPKESRLKQSIKVGFFVLVVVATVWYLWGQREEMIEAVEKISIGRFLLSGFFALVATAMWAQVWIALLKGMGVRPPAGDANSVFYVSQLGKYLPGKLWPALMQMQAGLRWGASRRLTLGSNILFLGIVVASGIAVGAVLLPWTSSGGLTRYWWLLLMLIPLAVGLHPKVVPGVLDWLFVKIGKEPLGLHLTARGLFAAIGWAVATWVVFGIHLIVLMQAYGPVTPTAFAAATGGMGLSWAGGIASLIAPAGVGVRDSLLVITLAPISGKATALTITLGSRVLMILADVILAAFGALAGRRTRS